MYWQITELTNHRLKIMVLYQYSIQLQTRLELQRMKGKTVCKISLFF